MYTTATDVSAFKKRRGLPDDYKVDGLLASGTWDLYADKHHTPYLVGALEMLGIEAAVTRIVGEELGHAFEFLYDDKRYWFVPVMGTAVMSRYAHLACMLGSRKNILVGVAGGLKKGIQTADFIIPNATKGNESAFMYDRTAADLLFYPDEQLSERLACRLSDCRLHKGATMTCEVMFAETPEDIANWSGEGYVAVEMESALIFALSRYFKVPAASILHVADNLIAGVSLFDKAHADSKEARRAARKRQYEVAVAELLGLPMQVTDRLLPLDYSIE